MDSGSGAHTEERGETGGEKKGNTNEPCCGKAPKEVRGECGFSLRHYCRAEGEVEGIDCETLSVSRINNRAKG